VDIVLMDLGNPRLFEADASHGSIKAQHRLSKSRARRNVHTLPFSLDKSGRNGEFGKGLLLTFVPRALLLAPCLSPEPWSLQNRGHCKIVVTAKSWSLQNRGHCKVGVALEMRLGACIGASRPYSKDSVHHRVDEASMALITNVY
jgi:hypothetical protein